MATVRDNRQAEAVGYFGVVLLVLLIIFAVVAVLVSMNSGTVLGPGAATGGTTNQPAPSVANTAAPATDAAAPANAAAPATGG